MIYKGSNQPIRLELDDNILEFTKISCVLYNKRKALKKWTEDDVVVTNEEIQLPLKETETLAFPACKAELEVKWLNENNVEFAQIMSVIIVDRRDDTLLTEEGGTDES